MTTPSTPIGRTTRTPRTGPAIAQFTAHSAMPRSQPTTRGPSREAGSEARTGGHDVRRGRPRGGVDARHAALPPGLVTGRPMHRRGGDVGAARLPEDRA